MECKELFIFENGQPLTTPPPQVSFWAFRLTVACDCHCHRHHGNKMTSYTPNLITVKIDHNFRMDRTFTLAYCTVSLKAQKDTWGGGVVRG